MKAQKTTLIGIFVMVAIAILLSNLKGCQRQVPNDRPDLDSVHERLEESVVDVEDTATADTIAEEQLQGEAGNLRVALVWDNLGDIDVHVVQPNGKCIDFKRSSDSGGGGRKDVDNTVGGRGSAENIYWETPKPGVYKVFLHYYPHEGSTSAPGKCPVLVEWKKPDGTRGKKQFNIQMNQQGQWSAVTDFKVEGGNVTFSAPSQRVPNTSQCKVRSTAQGQ